MGSTNEIAQEVGKEITAQAGSWQDIVSHLWENSHSGMARKASPACDQLPSMILTDSKGEGLNPEDMRASEIRQAFGDLADKKLAQYLFPETADVGGERCVSSAKLGTVDLTDPKGPKHQLPGDFAQQAERLTDGLTGAEAAQILQIGKGLGADSSRMLDAALAVSSIPCIRMKDSDGTIGDTALVVSGRTDAQEMGLVIQAYEKVLAAVGTNSPVETMMGDVLPPIQGTTTEDNLKNVINVLRQFAVPALEAELKLKN